MIFDQRIIGGSRTGAAQWGAVVSARQRWELSEIALTNSVSTPTAVVNAGIIPQDVWQDFDRQAVEVFRLDDGDTYLNDLLARSKSVSIGKLVSRFRQVSRAGTVKTSMSGQIGVSRDNVAYSYDGAIVPIHQSGFHREWREKEGQDSESFDALLDDQREILAASRSSVSDDFLDGHTDEDGNFIVVDGLSWEGMRNDGRVSNIDLGGGGLNFDFTLQTETFADIEIAWKAVRDIAAIDNKFNVPLDYYVSPAIATNLERQSGTLDSRPILQRLAGLTNVNSIKITNKLVDNELMAFPNTGEWVQPVVGMGINTVALPRTVYNANYEFDVWGAIGFKVKTDYDGNSPALYAAG